MARPLFDVLIVGAGLAGSVMAERLAAAGRTVLMIDARPHVGGNAYDRLDDHGHLIHPYGPHIFHTNSTLVVEYLSRFTEWRPYEHRVLARVRGQFVPIPINRTTINRLYGMDLDPVGIEAFLDRIREPRPQVRTSEDAVVDRVGRGLYELLFRGYTRKQWGLDPSQLDSQVTARIPVRYDDDDRYFTDAFQQMPRDGYHAMFSSMTSHQNIRVQLGCPYDPGKHAGIARHIVWTGPIDAFFSHAYGRLPYRSLRFEHFHDTSGPIQPVAVINEPDETKAYTRTTEFSHMTGCTASGSSLVREYPQAEGDPYYPVPTPAAKALAEKYRLLAESQSQVTFVGRLAQYRYYNMDQVVGAALSRAERLIA